MRCSELLAAFLAERPLGNILTDEQIERHLKNAIRLYCAYATLTNAPSLFEQVQAEAVAAGLPAPDFPDLGQDVHSPIDSSNRLVSAQDFDLTPSEYGLIWPLFKLYVEREDATGQESSRSLGIEQYGRSSSEVESSIVLYEEALPKRAFFAEIITI